MCAAAAPLFKSLQLTFSNLQAKELVISQQAEEIDHLICKLCAIGIKHVNTDRSHEKLQQNQYFMDDTDEWWLKIEDIVHHIEDQGTWAHDAYSALSVQEKVHLVEDIGDFLLNLVKGLQEVRAERDSKNKASMVESPPVFPAQLCQLRPRVFNSTVLGPRQAQLKKFWSPSEIEKVEIDHRELCTAYKDEVSRKQIIDAHHHKIMFNDAWDSMDGRFQALRRFSSGLATSFPNTTSVESDFSVLKWEKSSNRNR
jgi:hypothetical protein